MFRSKVKSDDYHDEMNGKHFAEWFQKQLLPNLPRNSVIVVDNAPYHNVVEEKIPTKSSRKGEMQAWLTKHNIDWEPKDLKKSCFKKFKVWEPKKGLSLTALPNIPDTLSFACQLPIAS